MSYFQNPFATEFRGSWILGDISDNLSFTCPANAGRGDDIIVSWADGPFDLSGNDADGNISKTLNFRFSTSSLNYENWSLLAVDITTLASSSASTTHAEIVNSLNANAAFATWFTAELNSSTGRTTIRSRQPSTTFRFFVVNGQAEAKLLFNQRAGVAELPTYFDRHKFAYLFTTSASYVSFIDRQNALMPLTPGTFIVDANVITNAKDAYGKSRNLDYTTVRADWQLLDGKSDAFMFQKICLDAFGNISQIIEYQAGSKAGDLAKKTCYYRNGGASGANPFKITEVPYMLTSSDLVTPDCTEATVCS